MNRPRRRAVSKSLQDQTLWQTLDPKKQYWFIVADAGDEALNKAGKVKITNFIFLHFLLPSTFHQNTVK
ncbi:MAG: hypothetical protein LBC53_04450 [Spirochaetaceae bacterium]|nr:hypothetical protein [Spirochaetaceae bacterium]